MGFFLGLCIGLMLAWVVLLTAPGQTEQIKCDTHGATLLNKHTPDKKYLTFYCVKNGKVVP